MRQKMKTTIFAIISILLVLSILGCSSQTPTNTADESISDTTEATVVPMGYYDYMSFCTVENNRYCIKLGNYDYYREVAGCLGRIPEGITATSLNALQHKLRHLPVDDFERVAFYSQNREMIVDFNKYYIPILPEDFCLITVSAKGEKNGFANYTYAFIRRDQALLSGDGELDLYRTLAAGAFVMGVVTFCDTESYIEAHEEYKDFPIAYVAEDEDKRVSVIGYNDILVTKGDISYLVQDLGFVEDIGMDVICSDEWLLSFDLVKYIPE